MSSTQPLSALRQFVRPKNAAVERCDFCRLELGRDHRHLLELSSRKLACVCDACAVLFPSRARAKYAPVPRRVRRLEKFRLTDAQWESLMIPIDLAFLTRDSMAGGPSATYPSPAGPAGSTLRPEVWEAIMQDNPALHVMEGDVEALLVNRIGGARDYYVAPIDRCYELTGLIRTHWRGFSGGADVWLEITRFFATLNEAAVA